MERKKGFDVARGIGIFLIVWSHTMSDGEPLRSFLFSFHVPLFFLISGYFFECRGEKCSRWLSWIGLYIMLSILDVFVLLFFNPALFNKTVVINGMLGMDSQLIFNSPKWFLLCLIEIQFLMGLIVKLKVKIQMLIVILFLLLGGSIHSHWFLGLNLIFVTFPFFYLGYLLKKKDMYEKVKEHMSKMLGFVCVTAMSLIDLVGSQFNGMVSIQKMYYGNYIIFLICALCGSATVILIGIFLEKLEVLSLLGQNTMPIFLLHYYLVRGLATKAVPSWFDTIIGQLAITIVSIGVILMGVYVIGRRGIIWKALGNHKV